MPTNATSCKFLQTYTYSCKRKLTNANDKTLRKRIVCARFANLDSELRDNTAAVAKQRDIHIARIVSYLECR